MIDNGDDWDDAPARTQLNGHFNSFANPAHTLSIHKANDLDLYFCTHREGQDRLPTTIRLRSWSGGGRNLLLYDIFQGLLLADQVPGRMDFFNAFHAAGQPNAYKEKSFYCDDNPGSHFKISVAENAFGIQTNTHDEEANIRAGGFLTTSGEGPMVWLSAAMLPDVHKALKKIIVAGKIPRRMRDQGLHPYS